MMTNLPMPVAVMARVEPLGAPRPLGVAVRLAGQFSGLRMMSLRDVAAELAEPNSPRFAEPMATAEPLGARAATVMATAAPLGAVTATATAVATATSTAPLAVVATATAPLAVVATATAPLAVVATPAGMVAAAALPGAGAGAVNGVNAEVNARAPPPPNCGGRGDVVAGV